MSISEADIAAVRVVLDDISITPKKVAQTYSSRALILVAVTMLAGAGKTTFDRGEYGALLYELGIGGGKPIQGWPVQNGRIIIPSWYKKQQTTNLTRPSRNMELHTSQNRAGNGIELQLPQELQALLDEKPTYRERAQDWYNAALLRIEQRQKTEEYQREMALRLKGMRLAITDAIERDVDLWERLLTGIVDPTELRSLATQLTAIADQHFPQPKQ